MTKGSVVFAFVPQRAGTDPSKPGERRFINTHLSRLAADRRRQGKPKVANVSLVVPRQTNGAKVKIPRAKPGVLAEPPSTLQPSRTTSTLASDTSDGEPTETPEASSETEATHTQAVQYMPTTVATNGSYDPFQSTQIPITSQVHELLLFNSTMFTPWGIGIEKGDDKHGAFSNKFAQTSLEALGNKGTGYANLARLALAAAAVTSNPRLDILATRFKMLAYSSLRESMTATGSRPDRLLLTQVFSLVSMETTGRQDDNAAMHTKTLRHLIMSDPQPTKLDKKLLSSICWHESMRCALTGRRPILNIESFIDSTPHLRVLFTTKLKLDALGLMPAPTNDGFSSASSNPRLLACLREMRFIHDLSHALQSAPAFVNDPLMEAYGYRASLTYCRLFEIYNDILDRIRDSRQGAEEDNLAHLYTETSMALCANYSLRAITSHEPIDIEYRSYSQLSKIYSSHRPLLSHLREAYHYCKASGWLHQQQQQQQQVWLWILRVATLAERADMFPYVEAGNVVRGHFHRAFVAHASWMGLAKWEDVENLLQQFLPLDGFKEKSRGYFEMALTTLGLSTFWEFEE